MLKRDEFWRYCGRAEASAKIRSARAKVPYAIDRYFIDQLLVDQKWLCAISKIPLTTPGSNEKYHKNPFSPSLDRIVPQRGYVPGNLRIVCTLVNFAMNEWGYDDFKRIMVAIQEAEH